MRKLLFFSAFLGGVIFSLLSPATALAAQMDGSFPIYPNATPAGFSYNDPKIAQALKMGFAMFADTDDSSQAVDTWYRSQLPKSCPRHAESAGIQFKCALGVVNIVHYKGKTRIALVPIR